ncbi:MAG: hypothetical protein IJ137_10040 [Eubacterium sp.]|nr:hypothetical protein [Eubacterium sp.]
MKNKKCIALVCIMLISLLSGCGSAGGSGGRTSNQQKGVNDVLQEGMAEADSTDDTARQSGLNEDAPEPDVSEEEDTILSNTEGIDVDLTTLSSSMVYSEVYNMMFEPDKYIGKTIKMEGQLTIYQDDTTGNTYYSCIVKDAAACCAQGMEFILADKSYPEEGSNITVTGVFDTYTEDGYEYCTLKDAKLGES